jgi:hypothetical protein
MCMSKANFEQFYNNRENPDPFEEYVWTRIRDTGYRITGMRAVNAWKVCYFNSIPACNYKPDYTATWPQIILPQGVCTVYVCRPPGHGKSLSRPEAKFLDGLRGGESIPGIWYELSMESTTNINPRPYCKMNNALCSATAPVSYPTFIEEPPQ